MVQSYKTLKENFVSNLSGGDIWEINYVTAVAPAAYLLWSALQSRQSLFVNPGPAAVLIDFLLNVVGILLATTLYAPYPLMLNGLLLLPALGLCIFPKALKAQRKSTKPPTANGSRSNAGAEHKPDSLPKRPFITAYRGGMLVVTCLAIIAVDFRVFPRRFAKVENWGTSLMDMGVGSFVFTAGLVSVRSLLKARSNQKTIGLVRSLSTSMKHVLPLVILGLVRLYSVKGLAYAEHVTEYGVHWNFFFTLALLPPFGILTEKLSSLKPWTIAIFALLIGSVYEVVLETTNLKAYILTAPRIDLLSKNREGVFSFVGYLAIFLAGQAIGLQVIPRHSRSGSASLSLPAERARLLMHLLLWSALWSLAFTVSTSYKYGLGLQVSRRLANLPYVQWVAAFNCAQITLYCFVETLMFPGVYKAADHITEENEVERATSWVLQAFNRNGLAIFLVSNLFTGLINLTVDTLNMGQAQSMGLLLVYAGTISALALGLDYFNISIKL